MLSYKDFTKYFGYSLYDNDFKRFLDITFNDLTEYNILESSYITSEEKGIELGFTNNDAVYDDDEGVIFVKGNPIFSHLNFYPASTIIINQLPFDISFDTIRNTVLEKTGLPTKTKRGYSELLKTGYLLDHYKIQDIVISFDYKVLDETIKFIQVRSNRLVEHLSRL
ncbi:MAG TPA: hypothetical protein VHB48_02900 [Chitinophagaceae bacterium]|nr:hypothetical protein [Chitinophagaceae bacterium]